MNEVIKNISHKPNEGILGQKETLFQPIPLRKKLSKDLLYCKTSYEYFDEGSIKMNQAKKAVIAITLAVAIITILLY